MADASFSYYVPLDSNAIPSNVNQYIAQGPQGWAQAIGNLANDYQQGQDQQYQNRQRNLFQTGLPTQTDANGNPVLDANGKPAIDWSKATQQVVQAGGAPAFGQAAPLITQQMEGQLRANSSITPSPDSTQGGQQQGGQQGTSQQGGQQPTGTPAGASIPPSTSGGGSQPQPTTTPAQSNSPLYIPGKTLADAAAYYGFDPQQLANAARGSPSDPITDDNRGAIISFAQKNGRQQQGGGQQTASAAPQQPQGAGTAAPAQPAMSQTPAPQQQVSQLQTQLGQWQKRADDLNTLGARENMLKPGSGDADLKSAAQASENAALIRKELIQISPEVRQAEESKAFRTKIVEDDATTFQKNYGRYQADGNTAAGILPEIAIAKNLTLDPNFYSGPFHEGSQAWNQFQHTFGVTPGAALPQEAFSKITNDLLIKEIQGLGQSGVGRVLQSEVIAMRNGIATLGNTPPSNRAQLEMLRRIYAEKQDYAQIAEQVRGDVVQGRIAPGMAQKTLQDRITAHQNSAPLFSQQEIDNPKMLGAPDMPAQYPSWTPAQQTNWARSAGIGPGEPIRNSQGIYRQAR